MKRDRFGQAKVLSPGEIQLLFTEGLLLDRDRALFGVCLYTACRIGEACSLLTNDVYGPHGPREHVLFRRENTKGKRETREVTLHERARGYLVAYGPDLGKRFLFPGRHARGHLHKGSADQILREACARVGLDGVSTHSFRRTALTTMHNAGVPVRHLQRISGHRTLAALAAYLEVTDEQVDNAISMLRF